MLLGSSIHNRKTLRLSIRLIPNPHCHQRRRYPRPHVIRLSRRPSLRCDPRLHTHHLLSLIMSLSLVTSILPNRNVHLGQHIWLLRRCDTESFPFMLCELDTGFEQSRNENRNDLLDY